MQVDEVKDAHFTFDRQECALDIEDHALLVSLVSSDLASSMPNNYRDDESFYRDDPPVIES